MEELINQWFVDHFYNKALDTETFNYCQAAKADLISRLENFQDKED